MDLKLQGCVEIGYHYILVHVIDHLEDCMDMCNAPKAN